MQLSYTKHCTQSPCSRLYISKHTQHWLPLASALPKYLLLAALLLLSVFCFLPGLCIMALSPTKLLDIVGVELSSVVCVALLAFSANLHSFSANLCVFASVVTFLLSLLSRLSLLQLSQHFLPSLLTFLSLLILSLIYSAFFFFSSFFSLCCFASSSAFFFFISFYLMMSRHSVLVNTLAVVMARVTLVLQL